MSEALVAHHEWSYFGDLIKYTCDCGAEHLVHRANVTDSGAIHHFCPCGEDEDLTLIGFTRPAPRLVAVGSA